jgi:hypothetical protein
MYLRDSNKIIKLDNIPGEKLVRENYDYSRKKNCRSNNRHSVLIAFLIFIIFISILLYYIFN